jgi:hypothetical protein
MSEYKRLQRQDGDSSSVESFYPSSPKKLKFDYVNKDIAPVHLLSPRPDTSEGEGKIRFNFTELGQKNSKLKEEIERAVEEFEGNGDLVIEISNCWYPGAIDRVFSELGIKIRVFVDYEEGLYRATMPWPCHEGIQEVIKILIYRSTIKQDFDEFIEHWGSSRIALQGLNTDQRDSKYGRILASRAKRQMNNGKGKGKEPDASYASFWSLLFEAVRNSERHDGNKNNAQEKKIEQKYGSDGRGEGKEEVKMQNKKTLDGEDQMRMTHLPSMVVEVGYSESCKSLEGDAYLWHVGSRLIVELSVVVKYHPQDHRVVVILRDFSVENMQNILEGTDDEAEARVLKNCISAKVRTKVAENDGLKTMLENSHKPPAELEKLFKAKYGNSENGWMEACQHAFPRDTTSDRMTILRDVEDASKALNTLYQSYSGSEVPNDTDYETCYNLVNNESVNLCIHWDQNTQDVVVEAMHKNTKVPLETVSDRLKLSCGTLMGFKNSKVDDIQLSEGDFKKIWRTAVDCQMTSMVIFPISFNDLTKKGIEWYAAAGRINSENEELPDSFQLGVFEATHVKHEVLERLKELLDNEGVGESGINITNAKNDYNKRHKLLFKDVKERIKRLRVHRKGHDVLKRVIQQMEERGKCE